MKLWWFNDLSREVKIVLLVLLANGLPAFIILMSMPNLTEILFVWTIKPEINARLVGVMYSNAILLVGFTAFQTRWVHVRINMVVITLFSIFATVLTFFYLTPFLAHPWYHLAYWLTMYLILFFYAPYVFVTHEMRYGGKLPTQMPLHWGARLVVLISMTVSFFMAWGLLFNIEQVNDVFLWKIPPLVGGLVGVLFCTHAAAYGWALWDGDWLRVRSMFWQAPPTALMFGLLPLIHSDQLYQNVGNSLIIYYVTIAYFVIANIVVVAGYRTAEKELSHAKS